MSTSSIRGIPTGGGTVLPWGTPSDELARTATVEDIHWVWPGVELFGMPTTVRVRTSSAVVPIHRFNATVELGAEPTLEDFHRVRGELAEMLGEPREVGTASEPRSLWRLGETQVELDVYMPPKLLGEPWRLVLWVSHQSDERVPEAVVETGAGTGNRSAGQAVMQKALETLNDPDADERIEAARDRREARQALVILGYRGAKGQVEERALLDIDDARHYLKARKARAEGDGLALTLKRDDSAIEVRLTWGDTVEVASGAARQTIATDGDGAITTTDLERALASL